MSDLRSLGQGDKPIQKVTRLEQAARLLALGRPISEVAREVGVSRKTVYKWLTNSTFQALINQDRSALQRKFEQGSVDYRAVLEHIVAHGKVEGAPIRDVIRAVEVLSKFDEMAKRQNEATEPTTLKDLVLYVYEQKRLEAAKMSRPITVEAMVAPAPLDGAHE